MKLTMDEAMKHRVVGIAVIISIALVFVPAMIKKNNQRLEEKRIVVELPAKPPQPQMAEVNEPQVFAETRMAHVDLDTQSVLSHTEEQVKANPISEPKPIQEASQASYPIGNGKPVSDNQDIEQLEELTRPQQPLQMEAAKIPSPNPEVNVTKKAPEPKVQAKAPAKLSAKAPAKVSTKVPAKGPEKVAASSSKFAVQVGVFSETTNAKILQKHLSNKGIQSRLVKTSVHGKPAVKVLIGSLASAEAAKQLQHKLADKHQIKGFVTKGVG
ncbi:SPOR domain-containing protein [Legionella sp. W05-934-2]|jgi:DedD protein|uniref:SPOR domain-containing protein n=1 Tax=Legionella sp. W05-934-2 TaxID=1198649 RepID=UPI0034635A9B